MRTVKNKFLQLVCFIFSIIFFISCQKNIVDKPQGPPDPEEFIHYTIDATDYSYTNPADTLGYIPPNSGENTTFFPPIRINSKGLDGNYTVISFSDLNIAANTQQGLRQLGVLSAFGNNNFLANPQVLVNITEYGAVGEFIAGNFTGTLIEVQNQALSHNVTCSFRVRRTQ